MHNNDNSHSSSFNECWPQGNPVISVEQCLMFIPGKPKQLVNVILLKPAWCVVGWHSHDIWNRSFCHSLFILEWLQTSQIFAGNHQNFPFLMYEKKPVKLYNEHAKSYPMIEIFYFIYNRTFDLIFTSYAVCLNTKIKTFLVINIVNFNSPFLFFFS